MHLLAATVYTLLSNAANPQTAEEASVLANPFKAKARRPILTMSSLFAFDSFAGGMVFESFLSFWLFTKFDMSAATIGAVLVAGQGLNMVSLVLAPWVADRVGLLNTLVFTQVISNIMLILFAFAPSAIIAVTLMMLRSLFDEMDVPTRQAYMMAITDPDEHPIMAGTRQPRTRPRTHTERHGHRVAMGWGPHNGPLDRRRYHQNRLRLRHLVRLPPRESLKYDSDHASSRAIPPPGQILPRRALRFFTNHR